MSQNDITKECLYIQKLINVIKAQNKNHHKLLNVNERHSDAFVYILSGSCTYTFENDDCFTARAGDILYLSHHAKYSMFIHDENYRFIFCDFEFDCAQRRKCFVCTPKNTSMLENLFLKLLNTHKSATTAAKADATALLYNIYATIIEQTNETYINKTLKDKIAAAKDFIDTNAHDISLSVAKLADMAGVSEVYFRKIFCSEYGCAPRRYIISVRLKKAKQLLNYPFLSLEECAGESGFASLQYFCRVFKSELGITPTEYRNKR